MKSISDLLAEQTLFAGLEPDDLAFIAGCGQNVHFEAGGRLLSQGDPADVFYIIRRGKVAVEVSLPGRGPLVIETLGPGEIVGVSWLFPPYRCAFDAQARQSTSAIVFDAACLRDKCDEDPRLGYELFKRFAGTVRNRLQAARLQVADVYGDARA